MLMYMRSSKGLESAEHPTQTSAYTATQPISSRLVYHSCLKGRSYHPRSSLMYYLSFDGVYFSLFPLPKHILGHDWCALRNMSVRL